MNDGIPLGLGGDNACCSQLLNIVNRPLCDEVLLRERISVANKLFSKTPTGLPHDLIECYCITPKSKRSFENFKTCHFLIHF